MKLSQLIKVLQSAKKQYGDVPVVVQTYNGDWIPIQQIIKLHPYTAPHGCLNRNEPVNAVALTSHTGNASDLVIFPIN